jgi:hypothetical protein
MEDKLMSEKNVRIAHGLKLKNMEQVKDELTMASGRKFRDINVSDVEKSLTRALNSENLCTIRKQGSISLKNLLIEL